MEVIISKVNESYIKIISDDLGVIEDIHEKFSFLIKNHHMHPKVRSGKWNGIKSLYDKRTKLMGIGLLFDLIKFCQKRDYKYTITTPGLLDFDTIELDDLKPLVEEIIQPKDKQGDPIEPYDYQYDILKYQLTMERSLAIASTSAGKSLSFYLACRVYQMMDETNDKHIVLIVPTKNLVEQMYNDFEEYSQGTDWRVAANVQKVNSDYGRTINKKIIITTWQSLSKFPFEFYNDVAVALVDEVQGAEAPVLNNILSLMSNTPFKHGMTGSLDDSECHEMSIKACFGPKKTFVTAKQLIDSKRATKVNVNILLLDHPEENRLELDRLIKESKKLSKKPSKHLVEAKYIATLTYRTNVLYRALQAVSGNVLVLFDLVEHYGIPLYEGFKEIDQENTHLIYGGIDTEDRGKIKQILEQSDKKQVIFANYQTMSVGESIKNLHNVFFVSSRKAKITTVQSIGRLMRLHDSKQVANLYDVVDDLRINNKMNCSYEHCFHRLKYYNSEKHPITFKKIKLQN